MDTIRPSSLSNSSDIVHPTFCRYRAGRLSPLSIKQTGNRLELIVSVGFI